MLLSLFDMICDKVSLTCCHICCNLFFPSLVLTRWSVCRWSFGGREKFGPLNKPHFRLVGGCVFAYRSVVVYLQEGELQKFYQF